MVGHSDFIQDRQVHREVDHNSSASIVRFTVAERTFSIVAVDDDLNRTTPDVCEHARFTLCGRRFSVVEAQPAFAYAPDPLPIEQRLTARELQIAVLVAKGNATKRIARQLQISEWTVLTYMRRIFAKLGVDSRAAMVYRCAPLIQRIEQVRAD